jgi:hypothetical protein
MSGGGGAERGGGQDQVVLPRDGQKLQVEVDGGGADGEPGVHGSGGHGQRDLQVRAQFRAGQLIGGEPGVGESLVQ